MKEKILIRLRAALTATAVISIVWNVIKSFFDNMKDDLTPLLFLSTITFVAVLILPDILKKIWQFYAIISTGVAMIAINFIGYHHISLIIVISLITIISDALVMNYTNISIIFFDVFLSIQLTFIICFFTTDIFSIIFLLIMYVVVYSLNTTFGIKKPYISDTKKTETENTVENLEQINGITYDEDTEN